MNYSEFKIKMSLLPRPDTDLKPPYWSYWRLNLWEQAQQHEFFWKYPCVYHCMLVQHWLEPIVYEWKQLDKDRFQKSEYLRGVLNLNEESFRHNFPITPLSNNLIHQAYHLQQYESLTGKKVEDLESIVEFGGGYGAMCLLAHELGFKGKYVIYDLPEFSLLQEFYLSQHNLKAEWNPRRKPSDADLFMGLYSLSEVPPSERDLKVVRANSYLFLYSGKWQDYDNVGWFRRFAASNTLEWRHSEIQHLPDRQNWYSIGW